jgi:hypothetical protein
MEPSKFISMLTDDQQHPPGDLVRGFVEYCETKGINCIGVGERMHGDGSLVELFVQFLLPALANVGYKTLIIEAIFRNAEPELVSIYKILDGCTQHSLYERANLLKGILLMENPSFPILKFNYTGLLNGTYKINILPLIVKAHASGVRMYGCVNHNQVVNDEAEMSQIIADGGREQAMRLKNNGKLLIYTGDAHVISNQNDIVFLNPAHKTPSRISFGKQLYGDESINYLHLTLLCGTTDSLLRANNNPKALVFSKGGIKYYLERFTGLEPGWARYNLVEQEEQHRGILLYNNPSISSWP